MAYNPNYRSDYEEAKRKIIERRFNDGNVSSFDLMAFHGGLARAKETFEVNEDQDKFNKFKGMSLLEDGSAPLLDNVDTTTNIKAPKYKRSPKLTKETQALVSMFNARKAEVLQRQRAPGIAQTRFE